MDNSDSDDRTSSTSASSLGYNVPSTLAPNQRDLRIQAAKRNAAAAAAAVNTDDEQKEAQSQDAELKSRRPNLPRLDTKGSPYVTKENSQTASKNASDAIFAQLEIIQNLQDEITREHAKLESLHEDDGHTASTTASGKDPVEGPTSTTRSPDSKTQDRQKWSAKPKPERHKHGQEGLARERSAALAYDELAAGFQNRAKGVEAIMEKVNTAAAHV